MKFVKFLVSVSMSVSMFVGVAAHADDVKEISVFDYSYPVIADDVYHVPDDWCGSDGSNSGFFNRLAEKSDEPTTV